MYKNTQTYIESVNSIFRIQILHVQFKYCIYFLSQEKTTPNRYV